MIAVPWNYERTKEFENIMEPFAKCGIETWIAPGDSNWNQIYPVDTTAFANIEGFIGEGQLLGSTASLNTVWNDVTRPAALSKANGFLGQGCRLN